MKKNRLFSIISFFILLIVSLVFSYFVYRSQLIPVRLLFIGLIAYAIVVILLALLIFRSKSKFLSMIGAVLCIILCIAFLTATLYLNRAVNAAQNITKTKVEVASIGVYMLADEVNENTALTIDMTYGILEQQDRKNTDEVIKKLEEEFGKTLKTKSYEKLPSLWDALRDHEVDAMIVNSALLQLADEMPGYEKIQEEIREVRKTQIVTEKPVKNEIKPETNQDTSPELDPEPSLEPKSKPFVVYISGIDTREDELVENSRSDVNIIAAVNPETHQVLLITTPRDYYVPLKFPEYTTSRDKLTHAGIYGVQVSMDTLGLLYDVNIDYYFRVNFTGFVDIVEALGGVTVEVEKEFSTTEYTFPEGPNELNGYKALSFVRNRFGIGDQQRGRNQMAFIKGVIKKAVSSDMLLNFNEVLKSVEGSFETSMPYDVVSALVRDQIESGGDWNVVSYAVTGSGNSAIPYSMNIEVYVMDPDYETVDTAKDLIQQLFDGKTISAP